MLLGSLLLHAGLLAALFALPGVASPPRGGERAAELRAEPREARPFDPPPSPPVEFPPETPVPSESPRVVDPPPPEEPLEVPDDVPPSVRDLPPTDLPWSRRPRRGSVIGMGGGAAAAGAPPPPAGVPPPPDPGPTSDAVIERRRRPRYPPRAVERGLEGRVVLLVEVRPDGSVGEVRIEESSGHRILDRAAEEAVRSWVFRPALVNGQPVRSWVEQRIRFRLDG